MASRKHRFEVRRRREIELTTRILLVLVVALLAAMPGVAQAPDEYRDAVASFRAGNYAQAVELFQKAEAAAPGQTDALLFAAKAFVHLEHYSDAENSLRAYLRTRPNSPDGLYLLGYVLHRENRPTDSLGIYTKAAAIEPPSGDDLKIVGLNYVLLNDYADAVRWLEQSVARDSKNQEAWYYLGRAYYTQSRIAEADAAFHKALQLNPSDAKAENNLGLVLESEAHPEEAIAAFQRAIAWQHNTVRQSAQPYLNLGSILLDGERNEEALPPLEQAVKLADANASCHLKLGVAYMRLSRLEQAQKELETAARLEPENAAAHFQLGKLCKQIHAMACAQREFARAEEIQSRAAAKAVPPPQK